MVAVSLEFAEVVAVEKPVEGASMTLMRFGKGVVKSQKALGKCCNLVPSPGLVLVEVRKLTAEIEVAYTK